MSDLPRILVVDDHSEIRKSVTSYLERNGMRASAAENAVEMDARLAEAHFDLIVLDVMMPGEDGLSACRRLRKEGHIPILMLTALGDDEDRIAGLDGGADDYLAKPFNPKELVARISAGGTRNYGMAQDWVERDMNAVLAKDGLSVETASDDQLDAALEKVDGVMDALMERAKELGVEIGRTLADEEEATLPLIDEDDRVPNPYLQDLADMLRDGKLTEEQEETVERTLQSELFKELGEEGLAELRRGNYEVLDAALPSKLDQITVTQEFLEMTFEETGDQVFTDRAAGLQQDKATEVARLRGQQEVQELGRDLGRDRGLDDEMEF